MAKQKDVQIDQKFIENKTFATYIYIKYFMQKQDYSVSGATYLGDDLKRLKEQNKRIEKEKKENIKNLKTKLKALENVLKKYANADIVGTNLGIGLMDKNFGTEARGVINFSKILDEQSAFCKAFKEKPLVPTTPFEEYDGEQDFFTFALERLNKTSDLIKIFDKVIESREAYKNATSPTIKRFREETFDHNVGDAMSNFFEPKENTLDK